MKRNKPFELSTGYSVYKISAINIQYLIKISILIDNIRICGKINRRELINQLYMETKSISSKEYSEHRPS